MKLRALCFLFLLLGCSTQTPPTAPEQALVARVVTMVDACTPTIINLDDLTCGVYIVLNDRSMSRLSEIRHGIPFVEAGIDMEPERYALWLGRMTTLGLEVDRYIGPHDEGYEDAFYAFLGQEVPENGTST